MKSNPHAGQFKLKGKKSALLSCKCCTVENWKEKCRIKEAKKEIQEYELCSLEEFEKKRNYHYDTSNCNPTN